MRRRLRTTGLIAGLAAAIVAGGCSELSRTDEDPAEAAPVDPPADELEAQLRERGEEVAPYMILDGPVMRDTVEEDDRRDFGHMMHPGWCYKVIGLGGEGVEDLDIRVVRPDGVLVERDVTDDPQPYLGRMRPICPHESGTYRIEVRVSRGAGEFVAQVYRSI